MPSHCEMGFVGRYFRNFAFNQALCNRGPNRYPFTSPDFPTIQTQTRFRKCGTGIIFFGILFEEHHLSSGIETLEDGMSAEKETFGLRLHLRSVST